MWLWCGAAYASPDITSLWADSRDLRLGDTAYRAQGREIMNGECRARFDEGVLIPVYSGLSSALEQVVGVVFVGQGQLDLTLPERADAWRFANHRVVVQGESRADLAPVAAQETPWSDSFDRALILSAQAQVVDLLKELEPIGPGIAYFDGEAEDEIDEVYVVTERQNTLRPRLISTNVLADRERLLSKVGLHPATLIALDRVRSALGTPDVDLISFSEFRTLSGFGVARGRAGRLGSEVHDRWLSCLTDRQDRLDTGFGSMAFSTGVDGNGQHHFMRWSGRPVSESDTGPHVEPLTADSTVRVRTVKGGNQQQGVVETRLKFRAVGGPVQQLMLRMPIAQTLDHSWSLEDVDGADGTPLTVLEIPTQGVTPPSAKSARSTFMGFLATLEPDYVAASVIAPVRVEETERRLWSDAMTSRDLLVVLPAPVAEGKEITVDLRWSVRWMFSNWTAARTRDIVEGGGGDGMAEMAGVVLARQLGVTTGPQRFLPDIVSARGPTRWRATTRVGVPSRPLRPVTVAVSGKTVREWVDRDDWAWVEAQSPPATHHVLAVGRWRFHSEPGTLGLPSVRVHHFPKHSRAAGALPGEVRRVMHYLDRFLPNLNSREIEVYQDASVLGTDTVAGPNASMDSNGLVGIRTVRVASVTESGSVRRDDPHRMQSSIARQVAHQWWGQRVVPASAREALLVEVLAEMYADFYLRSVHGPENYEKRMKGLQASIERPRDRMDQLDRRPRSLSLTGATLASDVPMRHRKDYARFLLAEMLRQRVGDQAFFSALERVAGTAPTSRLNIDDFQSALERSSGQDLSNFFDWWVHGGVVPRLRMDTRLEQQDGQQVLSGCITSNLPFGRYSVPVEVTDQDGNRAAAALVDVVDGVGQFRVPGREGAVIAALDPTGMVAAWGRDTGTGNTSRCDDGLVMTH